jgi:hypothetical protein
MVVSYLQSQVENGKSIKIQDGNLGRLFLEFLCYYGILFDHTKYVIYTYPPNDLTYVDRDPNNFFLVRAFVNLEYAIRARVDHSGSFEQTEQCRQIDLSVYEYKGI